MYRLMQKYGKVFMAVFSAILMVGFALPSFRGGSMTGDRKVIGTLDGNKLYAQDALRAQQAWQLLSQIRVDPSSRSMDQNNRSVAEAMVGPVAAGQITRQPILFLLLQKEAQAMGMSVNIDRLQGIITNNPIFATDDPDKAENIKSAVAQALLVQQAFVRASSVVKISEPMLEHQLGVFGQTITLSAADFTGAQYASRVPPATADQLKAQFDKYADQIKGAVTPENPFGFGYRYPNRIKLQYIALEKTAVRKFVEGFSAPGKPKDPYEWEVEAQKYFIQHQSEYQTTPAPSLRLDTPTVPPTTKPFAAVHDDVRKKLIDDATDKRMAQIQERITSVLAADWVAYHTAVVASTQPATASTQIPPSSLGVAYNSVDYLQKLATQIQTAYGVLPTIQSIADNWLTAEDVAKVTGIGQAMLVGTEPPFPSAQYLMTYTATFLPADHRGDSYALQELEPSRPMQDSGGVVYIARVSAAQASHKPETLAEVEPLVRADVTNKAAYDLAKADAVKLLDAARKTDLKTAAAGKSIVTVGPLTVQPGAPIPGLIVSDQLKGSFLSQAFKLISTPTSPPSGKPLEMIELQPDGRVLVAELASLQATWTERSKPMQEVQMSMMLKNELDQRFGTDWFDFKNVASRLKYVPDTTSKDQDSAAGAPEQPMAPIF